MLDVPKLGLELLNNVMTRIAENEEDSVVLEQSLMLVENCRKLVGRTALRRGLQAISVTHEDLVNREREVVQFSLLQNED